MVADIAAAEGGESLSLRELLGFLQDRSFGMAALLFTLPAFLPLPPGLPVISGSALVLLAVQMIAGRNALWLPGWLLEKRMTRSVFARRIGRLVPVFRVVERVTRPRWTAMTGRAGRRILGGVIIILAVLMILPIPFLGNVPPALAVCVLAIALIEEDGLLLTIGYAGALLAVGITGTFAWLGISMLV